MELSSPLSEFKSLKQIEDFLQLCAILDVKKRTAGYCGRINATLARLGKLIPQGDLWIGAIALEHNLPLASRDQHFSLVAWLTLLDW